ncbi:MAG: hypothetical protein K6E42_07940 [Synergistes sp.]|nr:hypothetical protein [Synergistes sp.]
MEHIYRYRKTIAVFFAILFSTAMILCGAVSSYAADDAPVPSAESIDEEQDGQSVKTSAVTIDADNVSYNENTGLAIAEGNVRIRNSEVYLTAPYVEYDSQRNVADAYSDSRENVVIESSATGDTYSGKHLKYNMNSKRGVLTQASTKTGALYLSGGNARVMPIEDAEELGIIRKAKKKRTASEDIAEWLDVTATTCDFETPHYKLVTKKLIIYPGKKTILRKPKIYFGKTLLLTYPFDYIAGKKTDGLVPIVRYDSTKGGGLGIKGPIDIGRFGELDIAAIYWTQDIFEARVRYNYNITDDLRLFANTARLYNDDIDETVWRPSWGLAYEKNGWEARLWWAEREIIKADDEAGSTDDYDVWRKPEFYINTPWFDEPLTGGRLRLTGIWGKYKDNSRFSTGNYTERFVYGASYIGRPKWSLGIFKPFYGARYFVYDYPDNDRTQKVTNAWFGFRYKIGEVSLSSAYRRRWVDGSSPMRWDRYYDNEYFIQTISFPLPIPAKPWQKWSLSIAGRYDLKHDDISSLRYTLSYDMHCMTWRLWYHDNRSDDEKKVGLTFFINAYPEYRVRLGSDDNSRRKRDDF